MFSGLMARLKRFRNTPEYYRTSSYTSYLTYYGYSVSVSDDGNIVAVGSPFFNGGSGQNGQVEVLRKQDPFNYTAQTLTNPTSYRDGRLGWSVAVSGDGNYIVAGAPRYFITNAPPSFGYIIIWRWDSNQSIYVHSQTIFSPIDDDGRSITDFGTSVDLDYTGTTLIVGAPTWDAGSGSPNDDRGAGIIYTRSGTTFSQQLILKAPIDDAPMSSAVGSRVSISSAGNRIVLAGPNAGPSYNGGFFVWDLNNSVWALNYTFIESDASAGFTTGGCSISGDGNTIIAATENGGTLPITSWFRVFKYVNGSWNAGTKQLSLTGTISNMAINYNGNLSAITSKSNPEKVEIFNTVNNNSPVKLNPNITKNTSVSSDENFGEFFGLAISNNSRTIVIGSPSTPVSPNGGGAIRIKYRR